MHALLVAALIVSGAAPDSVRQTPRRDSTVTTVVQSAPRAESLYISILEKTNQQLSLWWNPYGLFVGALGVLFAAGAVVVGYALFQQSREYREMHERSIAEYKKLLDAMVNERLAQMDADKVKAIAALNAAHANASEEQRMILEQRIAAMENERAEVRKLRMPPPSADLVQRLRYAYADIIERLAREKIRFKIYDTSPARISDTGDFTWRVAVSPDRGHTMIARYVVWPIDWTRYEDESYQNETAKYIADLLHAAFGDKAQPLDNPPTEG